MLKSLIAAAIAILSLSAQAQDKSEAEKAWENRGHLTSAGAFVKSYGDKIELMWIHQGNNWSLGGDEGPNGEKRLSDSQNLYISMIFVDKSQANIWVSDLDPKFSEIMYQLAKLTPIAIHEAVISQRIDGSTIESGPQRNVHFAVVQDKKVFMALLSGIDLKFYVYQLSNIGGAQTITSYMRAP